MLKAIALSPAPGAATLLELTHRVVLEAADILREVEVGLADGRIDHRDRARLLSETLTAESVLASLRVLLEQMKKLNMTRAAMVTSSGFPRSAMDFADSRPLDLYNKDQLQELLDTVDIYGSMRRT